jgi:malate dehydrogenase (oxaloacetate-decarboxylating)(NADP+)
MRSQYHDGRAARGGTAPSAAPYGATLLSDPLLNKGTAFTTHERDVLGLRGLLPPRVTTIEEQAAAVLANCAAQPDDLARYVLLNTIRDQNETLYYRVLLDHLEELLPIVYTPTVGTACRQFGRIYPQARGLYPTPEDRGQVAPLLAHWPYPDVRVIVVTDGERILGLGDLGANGMGIPLGKLALYVAAGGIAPAQVLPVCLDAGTERDELLRDPHYLGMRRRRVRGEAYDALVDEFVAAASARFPQVLIQFEDFAGPNALRLLARYRDQVCCFNDDVQGTGAVVLAVLLAAERRTGRTLTDERIVIAGAGGAGLGIAASIAAAMGDAAMARERLWLVDSRGLVVCSEEPRDRHKQVFARPGTRVSLAEVVQTVEPTVLIGVSTCGGLFTPRILSHLAVEPLVLPLSNPTAQAECTAEAVQRATGGRALVATGSPFPSTSQCNNMYVFPGLGLGLLAAGAPCVTDGMFLAAARTLATLTRVDDLDQGLLLPPLGDIRRISREIARAVAHEAGFPGPIEQWQPVYLPH